MLLEGKFKPITNSVGFLKMATPVAAEQYVQWSGETIKNSNARLEIRKIVKNITGVFEELLPLTSPLPTRFVFVPTSSEWTAYFDNGWRGTDAAARMKILAGKLRCEGLRIVMVPHTMPKTPARDSSGTFGAVILEAYDAEGQCRRSIYAANDGGKWKFGQSGDPFSFENITAYSNSVIKERFTKAMLDIYLKNLGIQLFDSNWYAPLNTSESFLISKQGSHPKNYREYSLDELKK